MTQALKNITVIGAGAWGTALAEVLAGAGHRVTLYARDAVLADTINATRQNAVYLQGVNLNPDITATADVEVAVSGADAVLQVAPAQHLRATLTLFRPYLPEGVPVVNCAKGIEVETGLLLSEVAREVLPDHPYAVLSGPTFAHEVVRGLPAAVTVAGAAPAVYTLAESLRAPTFRPYVSEDVAGVEIAGALKNVVAIACGIVEGRQLGQNARAAVMTRGMAEIRRLGRAKGALADTFLGLSGLGDLTLTCNSTASRNFSLGVALGEGRVLEDILAAHHGVAEGVYTARAVVQLAERLEVAMPICAGVDHILHGGGAVREVIAGLLSRALKHESI